MLTGSLAYIAISFIYLGCVFVDLCGILGAWWCVFLDYLFGGFAGWGLGWGSVAVLGGDCWAWGYGLSDYGTVVGYADFGLALSHSQIIIIHKIKIKANKYKSQNLTSLLLL